MATIPKAILDLLTNSKTAKFAESLKHSDLPTGWADDPEIVDLAAKALQEAGTDSPFFKAWFGKSKVLKGDDPRVMHHMTYADDLQAFDKARQNPGKYGRGFYFSEYPEPVYGNIDVPVYLKSENPAEVAANRKTKPNIKKLQEQGYTGVSIPDRGYQTVFEPEQIKSINNRGTFNPSDPNIYRTLAPLGVGTAAMTAALLGGGDEAKAAAINAALADPASREKAAAAGLPYDPPVEESAWSPADLLVAPVGAVGIPAKLLAMALDAPVTLGLDAGLSALGRLFGGVDRKKPGGW